MYQDWNTINSKLTRNCAGLVQSNMNSKLQSKYKLQAKLRLENPWFMNLLAGSVFEALVQWHRPVINRLLENSERGITNVFDPWTKALWTIQ